jgi:hypothetical protein
VDQFLKEKEEFDTYQFRLKQLNDLGVIDYLDGGYNLFGFRRKCNTMLKDPKKHAIISSTKSVDERSINPSLKLLI